MTDPMLTPAMAESYLMDILTGRKNGTLVVEEEDGKFLDSIRTIASGLHAVYDTRTHEVVEKGRLAELREVSDSWRRVAHRLEQEKLDLRTALTTARADLEAARRDGERYRWLRQRAGLEIHMDRFCNFTLPSSDAIAPPPIPALFDAAIDRELDALASRQKGGAA